MKRRLVMIGIVLGVIALAYFNTMSMIESKQVVEQFCSVKHQHNVDEYKACKVLTPNKLITKLTKDELNKYNTEVPTISLVPIK